MDGDKLASMERLLDRQDILDCLARMCRGADRSDRKLFLSTFHEDAIVSAGPFVGGAADLYDWSEMLQESYRETLHQLLNSTVDIDGRTAHVETYYQFIGVTDEASVVIGGRYIDRFERRDGSWGLVVRNNSVTWVGAIPALANPLGEIADLEANGVSSKNKSDPSYRRPLINRRVLNIPR